jgi:Flp pilus assembly protein TadG
MKNEHAVSALAGRAEGYVRAGKEKRDNCSGAVAAEFALVLPVMALLLFAIIKFGIVMNNYVELTSATSAGARELAISRSSQTPWSNAMLAFQKAAPNLTVTPTFTVNGAPCGGDPQCINALNNAQGTPAVASSQQTCDLTIMGIDFAPGCQLNSITTQEVE